MALLKNDLMIKVIKALMTYFLVCLILRNEVVKSDFTEIWNWSENFHLKQVICFFSYLVSR